MSIIEINECNTNGSSDVTSFLDVRLTGKKHFAWIRKSQDESEKIQVILNGACGALRPGRLTFILGPSGAGKTSLLKILAKRKKKGVKGSLYGTDRNTVLVAQHANLIDTLTGRETLKFAASLKLPKANSREREHAIETVSAQLGIQDVLHTKAGRMSGGERKRLTIACELLTNPTIMLLDEPTSGLDSVSSMSVARALRTVAGNGRTVACVIHQPSSKLFTTADDVILMAEGRTLYAGAIDDVPDMLARAGFRCPQYYNMADYLLEIASGEHNGNLSYIENEAKSYTIEMSKIAKNDVIIKNGKVYSPEAEALLSLTPLYTNGYIAGFWTQFCALLWRCSVGARRDVYLTQIRLVCHLVVALLLGALYCGAGAVAERIVTNTACLFFFLLFLFFSNAMPTVNTFPVEATVILQEHLNKWYSLPAYCIAKILMDLPVQLLCATIFLLPAWYLTSQPMDIQRVFLAWIICVLITILAQTFGFVLGAACDVKLGMFVVPAANIPMLMFSEFFIPYHEMPFYLRPFAAISYFRYAFDAFIQTAYGFDRERLPCNKAFCMFKNPQTYLNYLGLNRPYLYDVYALLIWIVLLQISLICVLRYRVYRACTNPVPRSFTSLHWSRQWIPPVSSKQRRCARAFRLRKLLVPVMSIVELSVANGSSDITTFLDVSLTVQKRNACLRSNKQESAGQIILNGVCGAFRPGRLTFILGPSGAGKTSLLKILAKRKKNGVRGLIYGTDRNTVLVTQHATLIDILTGKETLIFAASLKLPKATCGEREYAIETVSSQLGIQDVLNTKAGRMSGGERKRLTIACELLTNPAIMLLDEPTSGLDSVSSMSVARALRTVAGNGRTVACVIHQPSSKLFSTADDVILMAEGRTLYAGAIEDAPDILANAGFRCPQYYNMADYLLEVASGEHIGNLAHIENEANNYTVKMRKYASNDICNGNGKVYPAEAESLLNTTPVYSEGYTAGFWPQLCALLWRSSIGACRDVHLTQIRLSCHVAVALLLGALYCGAGAEADRIVTNTSCLFFFLLFLFFSNSMPTVNTFPAEATVVLQEHLNKWYSLPAYCIAKILMDLPVQLLCATVFLFPAWYLTSQPMEIQRLSLAWAICVLITILAQTYGLVVGTAFSVKLGMFVVPAANIPMLMFSEFFIPYHEMPYYLRPFAAISYFRYAFDAFVQSAYGFNRENLPCNKAFCMFKSPEAYLTYLGLTRPYLYDVYALLIWIVLLQITFVCVLRFQVYRACR
ncbi:ABC transporter G family member 2-like [Choristoneura fumiferana]|uniref:ABC transporter G family member 2-like n=1 Tax=Choristoneura fumiferana TaxID=7141 RepID=UPI003D154F91